MVKWRGSLVLLKHISIQKWSSTLFWQFEKPIIVRLYRFSFKIESDKQAN